MTMGPISAQGEKPHFFMRRASCRRLCRVLLFAAAAQWCEAQDAAFRFDSVRTERDSMSVDVSVDGLFDNETLRGLRKGMTAGIEYQIQIWEERKNWFDALVAERTIRMKIGYDAWERKYRLVRPDTADLVTDEQGMRRRCGSLSCFTVAPCRKLAPGRRYRLLAHAVFQPMSMENMAEIKRWLSGEADDLNAKSLKAKKSPVRSAGDWLLGLVVNVSGFGDRVTTTVSPVLVIENGEPVFLRGE
jgi:hypothetical protein